MNDKIKNNPVAIIAGGVVVIMLVSFSLMLGGGMMSGGGMMNGYGWNGWSWGTMLLGSLGMIVFWIAVVGVIVWLMRGNSDPVRRDSKVDSTTNLELLQRRFAAGEINQAQFESARHELDM